MNITHKLTAALKFDGEPPDRKHNVQIWRNYNSRKEENARLAPLHLALVECVKALESSNKTILFLMEEYARGNGLTVGRMTVDHSNQTLARLAEVLK